MPETTEKRPKFPHIANIVTLSCNLRCELCILSVPYYKKPWHPSLGFVNDITDRAFAMGDYEIFALDGGEPLLRYDLPDIWEYALKYINRADVFKTVTNGSRIPSNRLLDVWKKYGTKCHIIVDDYGPILSPNARKSAYLLNSAGIPYEIRDYVSVNRHFGGWVDFRVPKGVMHTNAEAKIIYKRCGNAQKLRHVCNVIKGIIMPCHMQFQLNDRGILNPTADEYINLLDDTEPIEEKRKKMSGFQKLKSLTACMWCPGLDETVPRHTPAAQLAPGKTKFMSINPEEKTR